MDQIKNKVRNLFGFDDHSAANVQPNSRNRSDSIPQPTSPSSIPETTEGFKFPVDENVRIRIIPYNPYFPTIEKELYNGMVIPIGRHASEDDPNSEGIYFRSTVVSRKHALLSFINGEFFLKDVKSLGGTFVNSVRLSAAGKESANTKINHGDVIQFGVDYRPDARTGQVRNKDKCIEARVEFPRFNKKKKMPKPPKWDPAQHKTTGECCICISALYQQQALFIAPCAHTFHYRCIAPLLRGKGFSCPMCRHSSDLQSSLFDLDDDDDAAEQELDNFDDNVNDDDDSFPEAGSPIEPSRISRPLVFKSPMTSNNHSREDEEDTNPAVGGSGSLSGGSGDSRNGMDTDEFNTGISMVGNTRVNIDSQFHSGEDARTQIWPSNAVTAESTTSNEFPVRNNTRVVFMNQPTDSVQPPNRALPPIDYDEDSFEQASAAYNAKLGVNQSLCNSKETNSSSDGTKE